LQRQSGDVRQHDGENSTHAKASDRGRDTSGADGAGGGCRRQQPGGTRSDASGRHTQHNAVHVTRDDEDDAHAVANNTDGAGGAAVPAAKAGRHTHTRRRERRTQQATGGTSGWSRWLLHYKNTELKAREWSCAPAVPDPAEESAAARPGCAPGAPDRATPVERTAGGLDVVLRRLRRAARALANSHSHSKSHVNHI
jgi:hypothetical protein